MTIAKNPWRWIFLGMTVLWMGFIFGMSGSTGDQSQETSGRLASLVQQLFFQNWETLPEEEFLAALGQLNFFLRKLAHFTEYFILGGLLYLDWRLLNRGRVILPLGAGLIFAAADEYLQTFIPGRSGEILDTLLDFCGVAAAVTAALLLRRRRGGRNC